jgi:hypothetical protein
MYVRRNVEARSCNHCCSGKAISISHSKCVFVALGIQHAMRMHRVILSSVVGPALHYFSTYLMNSAIFRKYFIEHQMCVLIFSITFV